MKSSPIMSDHGSRRLIVVALLIVAVAPHLYQLINERGTCFGTDDGRQVLAARHWQSHGQYATLETSTDLSSPPSYKRLTRWPPTYSALVVVVLKAGVPLMYALLLIRSFLLVTAVAGWFLIGRLITRSDLAAAFLVIPVTFRLSMNPTDLILCAVSPFLILALLEFISSETLRKKTYMSMAIAVALIAMVFVKYSALYFVPGVLLILGIDLVQKKRYKGVLALLGVVTLAGVVLGQTSYWKGSTDPDARWRFDLENASMSSLPQVLATPFPALLLEPFKMDSAVEHGARILASRTSTSTRMWTLPITTVIIISMIVLLLYYARSPDAKGATRNILLIVATIGLCAIVFLLAVDITLSLSVYAAEYRYYAPVAPTMIFVFARLAQDLMRRESSFLKGLGASLTILFVPLFIFVGIEVRDIIVSSDLSYRSGMQFVMGTVARVRGDEPAMYQGHLKAFCQVDLPVVNLEPAGAVFWDKAVTDRPVWLFLLENRRITSGRYVGAVETLSRELGLNAETQDGWEVHYGRLTPGFSMRSDSAGAGER